MIEVTAFLFLALLTLGSAVLVVTLKNIFHCALWLVVSLSGVGALYALLGADFLFAVQILLYAGGVMVVLLFVVLLSGKPSDWAGPQHNHQWPQSLFAALVLAACVGWAALLMIPKEKILPSMPTTAALGRLLLGPLILPFEIISLVILIALMGAIFFSKKQHDEA